MARQSVVCPPQTCLIGQMRTCLHTAVLDEYATRTPPWVGPPPLLEPNSRARVPAVISTLDLGVLAVAAARVLCVLLLRDGRIT